MLEISYEMIIIKILIKTDDNNCYNNNDKNINDNKNFNNSKFMKLK